MTYRMIPAGKARFNVMGGDGLENSEPLSREEAQTLISELTGHAEPQWKRARAYLKKSFDFDADV